MRGPEEVRGGPEGVRGTRGGEGDPREVNGGTLGRWVGGDLRRGGRAVRH